MKLEELLRDHPFVRGLTPAQLSVLLPCARPASFRSGAVVFREGGDADAVYLLIRGRVVLEQHIPGKRDVQLENLVGGDMLGLSWLFPGASWILDARAVEATDAVAMDARCLREAMDADATLGLALAKHVIQQLYQRLERVRLQRLDVYRSDR